MIKPSIIAKAAARKRAKARNRAGAPINMMDVLMALDKMHKRIEDLEKELEETRNRDY